VRLLVSTAVVHPQISSDSTRTRPSRWTAGIPTQAWILVTAQIESATKHNEQLLCSLLCRAGAMSRVGEA
jgi:hypothetical protein